MGKEEQSGFCSSFIIFSSHKHHTRSTQKSYNFEVCKARILLGGRSMETSTPTKQSKKTKKIPLKSILVFVVLIGLVAAGVFWYQNKTGAKNVSGTTAQKTAAVRKGELVASVSGSGAISSTNKANVMSEIAGRVVQALFKDGDRVNAGDVILRLDDSQARLNVKQLENSISQLQLTQQYNQKSLDATKIMAPIDGEVTDVQIRMGDEINKNASLLTITDKSKLKLTVSFNNNLRSQVKPGQEVSVNIYDATQEKGSTIQGSITSVSEALYKTREGTEVYNVEVVISNPGDLKEGMAANVETNAGGQSLKSSETGTLSYNNNVVVKASTSGQVEKIHAYKGQPIAKGTVLAELTNEDLVLEMQTNDLKLQDYYTQLETAQSNLNKYIIYAPLAGVLTLEEDIKAGEVLKEGTVLGYVADYNHMQFEISVDELDISKVKVGQEAAVSIDALPETSTKPYSGEVSKIAIEGSSSDGVATYPVTIQIHKSDNLKSGMNANAEITIEKKENTLFIPIEAVIKRGGKSIVYVRKAESASKEDGGKQAAAKTEGSSTNGSGTNDRNNDSAGRRGNTTKNANGQAERYASAELREVKTGINNEEYIEILSGLKEGELVIIPTTTSSGTSTQNAQRNGGGGGMGMPAGGGLAPGGMGR
jgi:HlyD family secretion protein